MNEDKNVVSPERMVRVETTVQAQTGMIARLDSKLSDVDETLQAIGQHLATISARPEAKGFSENIKTISTTASVVMGLCGAIWWAISISTNPLNGAIIDITATQRAETEANIEARVHLEYALKRLEKLESATQP